MEFLGYLPSRRSHSGAIAVRHILVSHYSLILAVVLSALPNLPFGFQVVILHSAMHCAVAAMAAYLMATQPIQALGEQAHLAVVVLFCTGSCAALLSPFPAFVILRSYLGTLSLGTQLHRPFTQERNSVLRQGFADTPVPTPRPQQNHTHPVCAAQRSAFVQFAEVYARKVGLNTYYHGISKTGIRRGRRGYTTYQSAKDLMVPKVRDQLPVRPLHVFVDKDWHIPMRLFLAGNTDPVLLYTITPESASHNGEASFCFDHAGRIKWTVSGGAEYRHYLWDWGTDHLVVSSPTDWWPSFFDFMKPMKDADAWSDLWSEVGVRNVPGWDACPDAASTVYLVERKRVAAHRSAILLVPVAVVTSYGVSPLVNALHHFNPIKLVNDVPFVRFRVNCALPVDGRRGDERKHHNLVTTGQPLKYNSFTVPEEYDSAILDMAKRHPKAHLTSMQRYLADTYRLDMTDDTSANALVTFARAQPEAIELRTMVTGPETAPVQHYEYGTFGPSEDAKPCVHAFMQPLVQGLAFAPLKCKSNDLQCIKGRVIDIRSEPGPATVLEQGLFESFAKRVFPVRGAPLSEQAVWDNQTRPSQVRILQQAADHIPDSLLVSSFQKAESYSEPKDPRNISPIDGPTKLEFSRYTMAMAKHLANYSDCGIPGVWGNRKYRVYAFSATPAQIADSVARLCCQSVSTHLLNTPLENDGVCGSDASRMDGRWNGKCWDLMEVCARAFFDVEDADRFIVLMRSLLKRRGVTRHNVDYETLMSMLSGQPGTSIFNSLLNMFISFYALYLNLRNVTYLDGDELLDLCWMMLGIYGGDDGLSCLNVQNEIMEAGRRMGMAMKVKEHLHGTPGVEFLARHYTEAVWHGAADSTCDVVRQLVKLHITTKNPHMSRSPENTAIDIAIVRALNLVLTDANTPVLGEWARRVLELTGAANEFSERLSDRVIEEESLRLRRKLGNLGTWWAQYPKESQFPNNIGSFDYFAGWTEERLAAVGFDLLKFKSEIYAAANIRELLSLGPYGHGQHLCPPTCDGRIIVNGIRCCHVPQEDSPVDLGPPQDLPDTSSAGTSSGRGRGSSGAGPRGSDTGRGGSPEDRPSAHGEQNLGPPVGDGLDAQRSRPNSNGKQSKDRGKASTRGRGRACRYFFCANARIKCTSKPCRFSHDPASLANLNFADHEFFERNGGIRKGANRVAESVEPKRFVAKPKFKIRLRDGATKPPAGLSTKAAGKLELPDTPDGSPEPTPRTPPPSWDADAAPILATGSAPYEPVDADERPEEAGNEATNWGVRTFSFTAPPGPEGSISPPSEEAGEPPDGQLS